MGRDRRLSIQVTVIVVLAAFVSSCSYNKFTTQEEAIKARWGEVQNQLQRRNDLIPNLVETVKGYAAHEEGVYKDIADSRSKLLAAKSPEETIQAANQQTAALGRLLAVVENYPQLRANEQFNRLMDELSGTENRIAVARGRYNTAIQEYNTQRRRFPSNVTAKVFGFKEYPYYEAPPSSQAAPKVDFKR
jgi:LemA protein